MPSVRRAQEAVDDWFVTQPDLPVERPRHQAWLTMLSGERKRTIPVHLRIGGEALEIQSFFLRAPDENEAAFYAYLLRRSLRSYVLRFALHPDGDVLIVGMLPLAAVTTVELDRVMGQLLTVADEAFEQALRTGFSSYIEREQEWRTKVGAARNPIT